jgi:sporulation related protein/tetratricopeptide repeat protein
MWKAFWVILVVAATPAFALAQAAPVNPVYRRAQTLVNDGNAVAGRALVDSMIAVAQPGSSDYAEGVYWRAVLAATAADAEMDYRRIVVDYPNSPRVEDALIRLAQLEIARGNYDGALRHLGRLASEHPESPARARAGYWTARAMFDKNDVQGGCIAINDALARTTDSDTELRNQINYLNQRCAGVSLTPPAPAPVPVTSTPVVSQPVAPPPAAVPPAPPQTIAPPVDSAKTTVIERPAPQTVEPIKVTPPVLKPAVEPAPPTSPVTGSRVWSVQVAAYNAKSQADAMVAKLKKSGYEARVDGTGAPFRVRIGKYSTQAQASAVQRSLKAKQITGFVVQADVQ